MVIMKIGPVIFVAFREFDNLGVGYLASTLQKEGYESMILDLRSGKNGILKTIKKNRPLIVGFSVVFQYFIYEFRDLITFLRRSGITSHFCAGGQYASMRYGELFRIIPMLDSIVRFEGEYAFAELVKNIHKGSDWRKVGSLVYKENRKVIVNPIYPPIMDLDKLPFPVRSSPEDYAMGLKFATLIASRGCTNNCSFCNNTEYIRQSSIKLRRTRRPEKVVEEMDLLYHKNNCRIFLFEDDDFPVKTGNGSNWPEKFCNELKIKGLADKIMWKINCRPDEVNHDSFSMMKKHGLFLVFLGIDDGTDSGLARLNKHMTVKESLRGINTLKKLDIGFDYGFMLFQPDSTFESINENLKFLKEFCGDGSAPVTFLKLKPYFDTKVEKELRNARRLKGKPGFLDYDFLSSSLDDYYEFIEDSLSEWIHNSEGVTNIGKWAGIYISIFSHFYEVTPDVQSILSVLRQRIALSNIFIINIMEDLSRIFDTGKNKNVKHCNLTRYKDEIKEKHDQFRDLITDQIKELGRIAEHQKLMQVFFK